MTFPCKNPLCAGYVTFDKDDKVTGNFQFQQLSNHSVKVTVSNAIEPGKKVGTLKIIQHQDAELKEQSVYFHKNENQKISQTDRFYLTCSEGHTLVYEINIEDE